MGLLDKVKVQAGQLAEKAQQGVAQGKDKLDEIQAQRKGESLLRELGDAYYRQLRNNGSKTAVDDAVAAMDTHVAEHGEPAEPAPIDVTDIPQP